MIKFEYIPWTADRTWGFAEDVPPVESVTMTLGHDVTWEEATAEFHNFLRAAGYVISYDFEDDRYIDCSDPPDMDKSGSLGDRQPEWANRMHGPDKWWHQSNTEVASEDESNTDVAEKREWVGLSEDELEKICDGEKILFGQRATNFIRSIEAKLKEKNI